MPLDTRRCFWFGTEERAGFISTPLRGADSSPSAWGVDGTLLNGGGYAFGSFGSHKRYTYEWPQSSSPEAAQLMKSYRDGTYGRGLLYFLEPGIYRTNILPAHWADPSMSLNNEAPALVYGATPIALPTSGGESLGLPVTSVQYDLSSTLPQAIPTPDSSVFLPVPTGHTLFLGAFYSSTGTGGVFVTPVNSNGTLGASVKLTEKPNSGTDVVTDRFSGDIRGVRLWVGRADGTASSVTIAAMAGRLMETADTVVYGPWVEQRRNLSNDPRLTTQRTGYGAGASIATVTGITDAPDGITTANRVTPATTVTTSGSGITLVTVPAGTYTISASLKADPGFSVSGNLAFAIPGVGAGTPMTLSETAWTRFSWTFTVASTLTVGIRASLGTATGSFLVTGVLIELGTTLAPYFDGSSNPLGLLERTQWLSGDNTLSVLEGRTSSGSAAKQAKLVAGPWIGGQGHSGCRFVGTPSYINNGPVEGGRVGYAATFAEVGSWVYG